MKKFLLVFAGIGVFYIIMLWTMASMILHKEYDRPYVPVTLSESLKEEIKSNTNNLPPYKVMMYCKDKTRDLLEFSTKCEPFNDRRKTKMHCVGYAQVFCTICNYAFKINHIKGHAKPVVGYVTWNRINLNSFSQYLPERWRKFTKDHDFAEVTWETNFKCYVDPTLDKVNFINY